MPIELPQPIFTPADKAPVGQHDENIDFAEVEKRIGPALAAQAARCDAAHLCARPPSTRWQRGIIIADTKFEFGLDDNGRLHLIDEVLTPDSSRFWPADTYRPGISPPSFDKQFVRDYLGDPGLEQDRTGPTAAAGRFSIAPLRSTAKRSAC